MYKLLIFIFLISFFKINAQDVKQTDTINQGIPLKNNFLDLSPFEIDESSKVNKIITHVQHDKFTSYFFLFLLNLFLIIVFLLEISRDNASKLFKTIFSVNILTQYSKVESKRDNKYLWVYLLLVLFFSMLILFLISEKSYLNINITKFSLIVILFFLFDYIVQKISNFIFEIKELKSMIHFNNFSFTIVLLPFLIISILLILFANTSNSLILSIVVYIIIFIVYLIKEFRILLILQANRINIFSFYFFLYLCTFKILPFIILLKMLSGQIVNPLLKI